MAAAAYGGLAQLAKTRAALAAQQDRFAAITRAVGTFERDLRQTLARPVRGNEGALLAALMGNPDRVELTRLGYANPRAEPRSNLQRVAYTFERNGLVRSRYAVLDRAPSSLPATTPLLEQVDALQLRYLSSEGTWRDRWPWATPPAGSEGELPRAVEFRLRLRDLGEIRRVVELPASLPATTAVDRGRPPGQGSR